VRILTKEFNINLEYYREKKKLNDQERKDLKEKITDAEKTIQEYKKNLEAGLQGFSEAGLAEMQSYVEEAKAILDGKEVGQEFLRGIVQGLSDEQLVKSIKRAARESAEGIVNATRNTLQIQSPSKVARRMGRYWDEGLVLGVDDDADAVGRAGARVAGRLIVDPARMAALSSNYAGGITAMGISNTTSNNYSTNLGGITVMVNGAGAQNEDVLAQRVAVRLTRELQRQIRGGGGR
jgi:hypothetical protein